MSAEEVPGRATSMDAVPADVWPYVVHLLSNADVSNLAPCSKACWKVSCHKRFLRLELNADEQLQSRLVSLLYYLTSRRERLQVCLRQQPIRPSALFKCCLLGLIKAGTVTWDVTAPTCERCAVSQLSWQ